MRSVSVLLCLFVVLAVGCGNQGLSASSETTSSATGRTTTTATEPLISTARIVCADDGTRVLTPEVEAQPDGVHFVIHNRMKADTGYSIQLPNGGGMGDNAPAGKSEHIEPLPPGTIQIGCDRLLPNSDLEEPGYKLLQVVDKDGIYRSIELECPGGEAVGSSGPLQGPDSEVGSDEPPVEQAKDFFSKQLQPGDTVELAGYPKTQGQKTVRVVRDGSVIATVEYWRESGNGWYNNGYNACAGF